MEPLSFNKLKKKKKKKKKKIRMEKKGTEQILRNWQGTK